MKMDAQIRSHLLFHFQQLLQAAHDRTLEQFEVKDARHEYAISGLCAGYPLDVRLTKMRGGKLSAELVIQGAYVAENQEIVRTLTDELVQKAQLQSASAGQSNESTVYTQTFSKIAGPRPTLPLDADETPYHNAAGTRIYFADTHATLQKFITAIAEMLDEQPAQPLPFVSNVTLPPKSNFIQ